MEKGTRCARACDPCRRRKERCIGGIPCNHCARRGETSLCQYTHEGETHVTKRRRLTVIPQSLTQYDVHVPRVAHVLRLGSQTPSSVHVGDSSTLGLFSFTRKLAKSAVQDCAVDDEDCEIILETVPIFRCSERHEYFTMLTCEVVQGYVRSYSDFVHGVFDIFLIDELRRDADNWSQSKSLYSGTVASYSALCFVLAIGAEQSRQEELGQALFELAYNSLTEDLLDSPDLALVQALLLLVLFLLLRCRRNAAMIHLGSAIQASHAIGLHDKSPSTSSSARARAWKCLRILDVSSCASLGRPLGTSEVNDPPKTPGEDKIDLAGIKLCSIAEQILRTVYIARQHSVKFALIMSEQLKDWADNIPEVLAHDSAEKAQAPQMPLCQQLCSNHMIAAYYWTIILLTQPFLMNDVLSRLKKKPINIAVADSCVTFVDACINSALRCLDATMVLSAYSNLLPKLFLVVNTTFVSALVLIIAHFGDYDRILPLEEGIEKAITFLTRQSSDDEQAVQYLRFICSLRKVAQGYCKMRANRELEKKRTQVSAIFGTVDRIGAVGSSPTNQVICSEQPVIETNTPSLEDWQDSLSQYPNSPDQTYLSEDWYTNLVEF